MNLKAKISETRLKPKEIAIFWLGQAGFLIKDCQDTVIVIDPYLSDCGERMRGFKRLSPKLISPTELEPDIYITTHIHFDHFDFDTVPIVSACPHTKFYGPQTCIEKFLEIGIGSERVNLLEAGTKTTYKDIYIEAVYADHGALAPDAIGILLNIQGNKVYFSGDTAYHPEKMKLIADFAPDIAVLSVNGKFGNLDATEGALVARDVNASIAIPCHFWTFKEHGGNPQSFAEEMKIHAPNCQTMFMSQGEMFKYHK